jgi:hypothetical protein
MRTTLAQVKASRIPESLNIPPSDSRLVQFINEATQRLLHRGHWWGTVAKYTISTRSGIITLPPQIATIEAAAVSNVPVTVRDFWYEFIANGYGTIDESSPSGLNQAVYRGSYCTFSDIAGLNKKLLAICDLASDVGKTVLLLGYDEEGNWIRTTQSGVVADGEVVTLAQTPGTLSTKKFASITDIQAPSDLDGQWWLYEYDTDAATQRLIGQYQYWETHPSYPGYFFPSIGNTATTVEILGKLAFIPVSNDTDYLIIGNLAALKLACMSLKAEEEHNWQEADYLMNGRPMADGVRRFGAIQELDAELGHYLGDGRKPAINLVGSGVGSADPVETIL